MTGQKQRFFHIARVPSVRPFVRSSVRPFVRSLPFWRGSKKTPGTVSRCCAEASEATDGARDEAKGGGAQGDEPNGGYVARAHRDR
jgi:hypothetical protein